MAQAGPDQPSSARITNYLLGGHDNTAADQAKAAELEAVVPEIRQMAKDSRLFGITAAGYACDQGISQFVDLGAGMAPPPSVHAMARSMLPAAAVAYVDSDDEVTDWLRHVMPGGGSPGIAVVNADLRDPEAVLADPGLREVIDPARPACILMTSVLHFLPPDRAGELVAAYAELAAPGSLIAASIPVTGGELARERLAEACSPACVHGFTAEQVTALFGGLELVPPGVRAAFALSPGQWGAPCRRKEPNYMLAGIGRKARGQSPHTPRTARKR